jgi:hypothetical protein
MAEATPASVLLTPDDDQAGENIGCVATAGCEPREINHRDHTQGHAQDDQALRPDAVQQLRLDGRRGDDDREGHRQEGHARLQRREAEALLHVIGEEEEDPEDARSGQCDRGVGTAAGPVADDVQRQQGMCRPALDGGE